jgi:hypothetical protein
MSNRYLKIIRTPNPNDHLAGTIVRVLPGPDDYGYLGTDTLVEIAVYNQMPDWVRESQDHSFRIYNTDITEELTL